MNEPLNAGAAAVAGAISHGLLALAQHRPDQDDQLPRHVGRRALQGGIALGAGALAWNSFSRGNGTTGMATILLAGAALLLTAEPPTALLSDKHNEPISRRSS